MKNVFTKSLVAIAAGSLMLISGASASSLPDLAGTGFTWTNADYWTVTDLSNGQGTFELAWENSNASYESSFGLYSLKPDGTIFDTFQLFGALEEPVAVTTPPTPALASSAWFKLVGSTWQVSDAVDGTYKDFGNVFGFYADVYTEVNGFRDNVIDYTWYTDAAFNGGVEHFGIGYNKPDHSTVIYMEDQVVGLEGDLSDITDLMVTSTDINPVPEPSTMLLFGAGLAGLAGVARRKKMQK